MSEQPPDIETAAASLAANRERPGPMEDLPPDLRPRDEAAAYRLQDALGSQLSRRGWGERVGYKIGCTTAVMQTYLGIDHPCAGALHRARVFETEATFDLTDFHRVGVECELAVTLGHDLPPGRTSFEPRELADAVGAYHAAIEVVDDRYADYRRCDVHTLIADDFFQAAAVLSPPREAGGLEPAGIPGRMWIDDRLAGEGVAADILGDPLAALAWLAELCARRGVGLRRGEVILLGSLVKTQWLGNGGGRVRVELDGVGEARAEFLPRT